MLLAMYNKSLSAMMLATLLCWFLVSVMAIALDQSALNHVLLWTRENRADSEAQTLTDNSTVSASLLDPALPSYLVVHGFMHSVTTPWVVQLKDALLEKAACNVLAASWDAGEVMADYNDAMATVPATAADLSRLLSLVHRLKGLQPSALHVVGHGLGAHLGGLVGKALGLRMGRLATIYGLDPTSSGYESTSPRHRLHHTDASLVHVIHTSACNDPNNSNCFGLIKDVGDSDVKPNGGRFQPACVGLPHDNEKLSCDHLLAIDYFLESLQYTTASTNFLCRPATSYYEYSMGPTDCGDTPQYMGFYAQPTTNQTQYFLNVTATSPYAETDPACPALTPAPASAMGAVVTVAVVAALAVVLMALAVAWRLRVYYGARHHERLLRADAERTETQRTAATST